MRSGVVDHLALQVGGVDDIVIDEAERAHAGRGEVEGGRRAEAAGTKQQDLRVEQLELALEPDLGDENVAGVPLLLLLGQRARGDDGQAAVAPERDPAGHRGDVRVAELIGKGLRRQRRAIARGAVEDDPLGTIGHELLDSRLEVSTGHVNGAFDVTLLELVLLAYVDQGDVAGLDLLGSLAGLNLVDRVLGA